MKDSNNTAMFESYTSNDVRQFFGRIISSSTLNIEYRSNSLFPFHMNSISAIEPLYLCILTDQ